MKKEKKILISFVGSNDAGKSLGLKDGAIITALINERFDEAILFWNKSKQRENDFSFIANYLKKQTIKQKLLKKIETVELPIEDVTDHNHIYGILKNFCDGLDKSSHIKYTAAISSGTPAMQVCWILLAESGDFSEANPLRLIKVIDPRFGNSGNINVKIDTSLPKILRLKEENESLKKELIPPITINIKKGIVEIGGEKINFAPIEFCYFRYFAGRAKEGKDKKYFGGLDVSLEFLKEIFSYHEESFPGLDINREEIRKMIKTNTAQSITTFRGNISKVNKKLSESINNQTALNFCIIKAEGRRGAKFYGIDAPTEKVIIK